jgi:hypothetical protein
MRRLLMLLCLSAISFVGVSQVYDNTRVNGKAPPLTKAQKAVMIRECFGVAGNTNITVLNEQFDKMTISTITSSPNYFLVNPDYVPMTAKERFAMNYYYNPGLGYQSTTITTYNLDHRSSGKEPPIITELYNLVSYK